jgi:hypothetical protein
MLRRFIFALVTLSSAADLMASAASADRRQPNAAAAASAARKETTPEEPPVPFQYAFAAGRRPGGKPDRYIEQSGDEEGVVKGSYTYLDPNYVWQSVKYVADAEGFHILPGSTPLAQSHPEETPVVAAARAKHAELFKEIAERNSQVPLSGGADTRAVREKKLEHAAEFARIAEEHARIGEEHRLRAEEEDAKRLAEEERVEKRKHFNFQDFAASS